MLIIDVRDGKNGDLVVASNQHPGRSFRWTPGEARRKLAIVRQAIVHRAGESVEAFVIDLGEGAKHRFDRPVP